MSKLKVSAIHDPDNDNEAITVDTSGNVGISQTASFDGNVGIGTTSPTANLDIDASSKDAVADLDDPNDYAIVIRNNSTSNTGNGIAFTNDGATNVGGAILHIDKGSNNLGNLAFYTNANSSGNPSERMRINYNGTATSPFTVNTWINFSGSTNTINGSHNVSSITDNGTGDWTINFSYTQADNNYAIAGSAYYVSGSFGLGINTSGFSTSSVSFQLRTFEDSNNYTDAEEIGIIVVGN